MKATLFLRVAVILTAAFYALVGITATLMDSGMLVIPWLKVEHFTGPLASVAGIIALLLGGALYYYRETDPVLQRAREIAPQLRYYISYSSTIQELMIEAPDKSKAVEVYAVVIEHQWRASLGNLLAVELPAAREIVLQTLAPKGLDPFHWELARLQHCTTRLESVLSNLEYWIKLSEDPKASVKPAHSET